MPGRSRTSEPKRDACFVTFYFLEEYSIDILSPLLIHIYIYQIRLA